LLVKPRPRSKTGGVVENAGPDKYGQSRNPIYTWRDCP
jgi:hypothetical protein